MNMVDEEQEASQHKVVVRRTFLDLQEPEQHPGRTKRRYRTTSVLQGALLMSETTALSYLIHSAVLWSRHQHRQPC
eukprot:s1636_g11.t1